MSGCNYIGQNTGYPGCHDKVNQTLN